MRYKSHPSIMRSQKYYPTWYQSLGFFLPPLAPPHSRRPFPWRTLPSTPEIPPSSTQLAYAVIRSQDTTHSQDLKKVINFIHDQR